MAEFTEKISASVATGDTAVTIASTFAKGTMWSVVEVDAYIPGAGDAAYIKLNRTSGTAALANEIGETHYNANPILLLNGSNLSTLPLKATINTGNAETVTVYFTVRYCYV